MSTLSTLCRPAKEKGHRVRVMDVLSAVEHIFNETAMHAKATASNRLASKRSKSWSKSDGKGKNKCKSKGNPKGKPKEKPTGRRKPKGKPKGK